MEFQDVVRRRRMIRTFDDRPVEPAIVERILANARRGPSAGFAQGWAFLALSESADRDRFWTSATTGTPLGVTRAPLIIVALSCAGAYLDRYAQPDKPWVDRDESHWPVPYWHVDTGMAVLLMLLTVVDTGLDACLVGVDRELIPGMRAAFGVPDGYIPVGAVVVGHRAPDTPPQPAAWEARRRSVDQVVHRGRWSGG